MLARFFLALDRKMGWLLNAAAVVSSVMLVGLMLFLVLARYVFGWSVIGLLELIMVFGMWLYMVGSLIAARKREHLVVDFLHQQIRDRRLRQLHRILVTGLTFAICLFFAYLAYRMLAWGMRRPQHTPGMSIPLWLPQGAILFAAIGCALYALRDLIQALGRLLGNVPDILAAEDAEPQSTIQSKQEVGAEC